LATADDHSDIFLLHCARSCVHKHSILQHVHVSRKQTTFISMITLANVDQLS